jgi:hypothetical protein
MQDKQSNYNHPYKTRSEENGIKKNQKFERTVGAKYRYHQTRMYGCWATVSIHTIQASTANPIKALHYE